MLFNSIDFAIFLPLTFILFWTLFYKKTILQNVFLTTVSFIFYGWWDWRFLSLITISIIVDYLIGILLNNRKRKLIRKILLATSIGVNLGLLAYFKYANFFIDNFIDAFSLLGKSIDIQSINLILPVGISFYTFQTLSYTIDVYNKKINATNNFFAFTAFVSFFPQLVAGPIERAKNLLPQFLQTRRFNFNTSRDGLQQILWGMFKKIVIADNCAYYANTIFNNYTEASSVGLIIGAIFFTFQIYGDFSGYSDIAIGTAKLFGFKLKQNFAFPYFSRDIAEFWRRWHISLSSWFKDYVYIPLGGSKGSVFKKIRNVFIIFLVSGFWHGANWTFIFWGILNAIYFIPLMILKRNRHNTEVIAKYQNMPNIKEFLNMITTFSLTVLAWILFRSKNMYEATDYIYNIFIFPLAKPTLISIDIKLIAITCLIIFLIIIEWNGRAFEHALKDINKRWNKWIRITTYYTIVMLILYYFGKEEEFIYFQF